MTLEQHRHIHTLLVAAFNRQRKLRGRRREVNRLVALIWQSEVCTDAAFRREYP